VATISRLLNIIGLFCKKALSKSLYSAKETHNFEEHTTCSHPIALLITLAPTNRVTILFGMFNPCLLMDINQSNFLKVQVAVTCEDANTTPFFI